MEWYMSDRANDMVVPNECKWKLFRNSVANDGDFSCETNLVDVDQVEMESLVGDGDQVETESSNCWTALLNNQDYEQLDGFPWTNQTDQNFLNTLLVDDQFNIYDSQKSQCTYSADNNLTTDMGSYARMDCFVNDWDTEQCDTSHPNLLQNTSQDNHSVEETVLQELGIAVQKMTYETRLCFRDAMFRLATNSEKQSSVVQGENGGDFLSEKCIETTVKDATEHRMNTIDRTIADLLFNKDYQQAAKPHKGYPQKHLKLQTF